ncbi:ABC transporter ATP-binding protein [Oenococcus oeni]|uniref:ABC transporter, ATP-binding protein n=4 Tax=Oenococcus oeni TaxID=1247 RepID=A0NKQ2_OENOE|nr:ABC transporter ATP-binding protein [Oenococcus oeni]EAV38942.1 ABC transporter, ATP-binding protein [Oenococcus oeni ATCC BAA-1163]KEP85926.1 ABC transporter ATPase [Oenococcus oeni IOEB_0205]KMQ38379.1 ABC transporter ATP-binding protein [Oenococcus oeni]USO98656.1 ABC transporter ATP-binding protein [Oenococcus oeni]
MILKQPTDFIEAKNISVSFSQHEIFSNLSFKIFDDDFFCLIGKNGIGKTTLVKTILGQLHKTNGEIIFSKKFKSSLSFGYVPQFRNIDQDYPLSIRNFVSLRLFQPLVPWFSKKEKDIVDTALKRVGIFDIASRKLGSASGGEKQKAYLAQAILYDPQLLILDESTASLDTVSKFDVMDAVKNLNDKYGTTVIFISHDIPLVEKYGKHSLELKGDGKYSYKKIN